MKTFKVLAFVFCLLVSASSVSAQEKLTSMESWKEISQKEYMADFFSDMFVDIGIYVVETEEKFTVHNTGKGFMLKEGVNEAEVELVLPVKLKNIKDLIEHSQDGKISEQETFRILSVLFTPLTASTLQKPEMKKNTAKWVKFTKNHIHVYLLDPAKERKVGHTLIYLNKEWIVIPGIHGNAKVTYKMTPKQAVDYQKKVYLTLQKNSKEGWKDFRKWYVDWSKSMAVKE